MLFLGAGASAAFGIPAMQELTKYCEEYLSKNGFEGLASIKESLARFGLTYDFESLLTILQSLSSPDDAVKSSGPFAAILASKIGSLDGIKKENAGRYIEDLKRLLVEKCQQARLQDAITHYRRLFEAFGGIGGNVFHTRKNVKVTLCGGSILPTTSGPVRNIRTQDIFTVNYDLVVEHYFELEGIAQVLRHGFVLKGVRMLWDPQESYDWVGQNRAGSMTNLVKLHGSIDQFDTVYGFEKRTAPPEQGYYSSLSQNVRQMMIFPVHEKYVTRSPYYDLFDLFRRRLTTDPLCVIIGYSFRDEAVNNALIDAAKTSPLKIIYVGGERANENLKRVPEITDYTRPINKKFGVDDIFQDLTNNILLPTP